ncbi:MAG: hypothetical protein M1546_15655 [Chloroflexi bacterium]|nr:hypothetical protein [Chloroflexota bacterium]
MQPTPIASRQMNDAWQHFSVRERVAGLVGCHLERVANGIPTQDQQEGGTASTVAIGSTLDLPDRDGALIDTA